MLSRVANSIYWLSRYTERAENVARFIDVNLQMILDLPSGSTEQWAPLVIITGDDAAFAKHFDAASRENVIRFLTFDTNNPNSIASCLRAARENARTIREAISPDMWEQINTCYLMVNAAASDQRIIASPYSFFNEVKRASHLFDGITEATMLHDEGWHFYRMGRLLERADKTSRLLDVKYFILLPSIADVGTPLDDIQWAAVLRSASALEMYRKRHGPIIPDQIIEFLVLASFHVRSTIASPPPTILSMLSPVLPSACTEIRQSSIWASCAQSSPTQTQSKSLPRGCTNFSTRCKRSSILWTMLFSILFSPCAPSGDLRR